MKEIRAPLKQDKVFLGITPTLWWNDDFLDIDIGITFGQCVSEMALAGFEGCSVGHKYPTDIDVLKRELDLRNLRVSEPWTSTYFTIDAMHDTTVANFKASLAFIRAMGGTDIVVAELGCSVHQQPVALFANRPHFTDQQWDKLAQGLNELGAIANDQGMRLCYHHHMGTGVQTREEIDRLAECTDPARVHFLFDTGHLAFAGYDPVAMARDYAPRIKHVHLKNVRRPVMEIAIANHYSFKEAIEAGIFTVPGDPEGFVDFDAILEIFVETDFAGWLIVEAEQDPAKATPLKYAKMARAYLHEATGL